MARRRRCLLSSVSVFDPPYMSTMNLEGLEMIAVLVVVVLFVKVLEQFGLLEDDYDGKETAELGTSFSPTGCKFKSKWFIGCLSCLRRERTIWEFLWHKRVKEMCVDSGVPSVASLWRFLDGFWVKIDLQHSRTQVALFSLCDSEGLCSGTAPSLPYLIRQGQWLQPSCVPSAILCPRLSSLLSTPPTNAHSRLTFPFEVRFDGHLAAVNQMPGSGAAQGTPCPPHEPSLRG
ncbi:unnamed protein product [Pleuronectes platessa]|uniref:Uncharacterized protein n=1 Tax=Pleuronectes platessa TaxID=8262 RepID=A0A9N7VBG3_PLEPL|nr:unnamed protein product [Pleuronectes platessa]